MHGRCHLQRPLLGLLGASAAVVVAAGCGHGPLTVAAIPQVAADPLWLQEHAGVLRAASEEQVRVYWNAPDREGEVQRQISLVEQVEKAHYAGLILAPEQELALTLPVKRLMAEGMPVVVVHAPLALPASGRLAYVVNNEQQTGAATAQLIADALHGLGTVAVTGVQPLDPAATERMRAFELALQRRAPGVHVIARLAATRDDFAAEESLAPLLQGPQPLDAVFALDTTAGLGAARAVQSMKKRPVLVVYGQDPQLVAAVRSGVVRELLAEDSQTMGYMALQEVLRLRRGLPVPGVSLVMPIAVTISSLANPEVQARVVNLPEEPL